MSRVTGWIAASLSLALSQQAAAAGSDPVLDLEGVPEASSEATRVVIVQEPPRWPLWAGLGVASAAAATGTVFGFATLAAANDGDPKSDPGAPATGANVAFAVAGTAAVFTAVLWLFQDVIGAPP